MIDMRVTLQGRCSCKRETRPAIRDTAHTDCHKVGEQEKTRIGVMFHHRQKAQEVPDPA